MNCLTTWLCRSESEAQRPGGRGSVVPSTGPSPSGCGVTSVFLIATVSKARGTTLEVTEGDGQGGDRQHVWRSIAGGAARGSATVHPASGNSGC